MSKMTWAGVVLFGCAAIFASGVFAQDEPAKDDGEIRGRVAVLGETKQPTSANVGGLLIVNVRDSGSRPVRELKVDGGRAFKRLGRVRGINVKDGRALMGGGYTWVLLSPLREGTHEVQVSYINADDETVKQTYQAVVTAKND